MPNAKVLESKKAIVDELAQKLQDSSAAVFVDYKGITVAQDTELRNQFRAAGVEYTVVKNTLTRFAANKIGITEFDELLNGTTSLARTTGDPIAPARVVSEFIKKNKDTISIKGGMVEGKILSVDELKSFGELPSKDALVAQVLGTFLAPITSLAVVLNQICEKGGGSAVEAKEEAPAEAPAEEAAAEAPAEEAAAEAPAEAPAEEAAAEAPAEAPAEEAAAEAPAEEKPE